LFPEKYKEFLLKYNGGNSLQTSFSINRKTSDIRAFYGFNKASQYNNFQYLIESGFLEEWARRGVLLMNTSWSVERGKPASAAGLGWMEFSEHLLEFLNDFEVPFL